MFSVSFAGLLGRILNSSSSVAELTVQWDCPFPPFLPSIRISSPDQYTWRQHLPDGHGESYQPQNLFT